MEGTDETAQADPDEFDGITANLVKVVIFRFFGMLVLAVDHSLMLVDDVDQRPKW